MSALPPSAAPRGGAVARPAAFASLAWVASALLGTLTLGVLAARRGVGIEVDAYTAASRLPNLFMVAVPVAMAPTLVPLLAEIEARRGRAAAKALAGQALSLAAVAGAVLSLALWLAAPRLAELLAPGLKAGPGLALTVSMLRWQMPNVGLSLLGGALQALHYRERSFRVPALAPLVQSGATIAGTLLLWPRHGIVAAAIGSLWGPLIMVLLLLPVARRAASWPRALERGPLGRLARSQANIAGAGLLVKSGPVFESAIASGFGAGNLTMAGFAGQIAGSLGHILSIGIATSIFPELAEHRARGDRAAFRRRLSLALRYTLLLALPATAGLWLLAEPLVALLLQRGAFDAQDSRLVALTLAAYAPSVAFAAAGTTISNALFAHQSTRLPSLINVLTLGVHLLLAVVLARRVQPAAVGLAWAASLSTALRVALRLAVLRQAAGELDGKRIGRSALRMLLATALMSGLVLAARDPLFARLAGFGGAPGGPGALARLAGLLVLAAGGAAAYAGTLWLLGATELRGALAAIRLLRPAPGGRAP